MKNTPSPRIYGFGSFVPPRVVTNHDLAKFVDTSDEWITSRTGIKQRHLTDEDVTNTDIGTLAAQEALSRAGIRPADVTHILYATCTPDAAFPSCACQLQEKLGITNTLSLDVNAACTSFVYGLEIARSLALATPSSTILLVATDTLSKLLNWNDRSTCVLFGDGSGAVVITGAESKAAKATKASPFPSAGFIDTLCSSDGSLGNLLYARGGYSSHPYKLGDVVGEEYFLHMQGQEVFKHAVRSMSKICQTLLKRNGLTIDDIDVIVPHQANLRIIEAVGSRLKAAPERVFINVDTMGNTSAASIPLALSQAIDQGTITSGNKVLIVTFGAGFTWAAALLQF